jgi:hypothetical protein
MVNTTPWLLYPREREPLPILQEAVWDLVPVWTGAENLAPPGFESLYRIRYYIKHKFKQM